MATPRYLRRIGLLGAGRGTSLASQLNTLMHLALRQLPFMPYARVLDQWRDGVLNGSIPREDWNCVWWDLRSVYLFIQLSLYLFIYLFINRLLGDHESLYLKEGERGGRKGEGKGRRERGGEGEGEVRESKEREGEEMGFEVRF